MFGFDVETPGTAKDFLSLLTFNSPDPLHNELPGLKLPKSAKSTWIVQLRPPRDMGNGTEPYIFNAPRNDTGRGFMSLLGNHFTQDNISKRVGWEGEDGTYFFVMTTGLGPTPANLLKYNDMFEFKLWHHVGPEWAIQNMVAVETKELLEAMGRDLGRELTHEDLREAIPQWHDLHREGR